MQGTRGPKKEKKKQKKRKNPKINTSPISIICWWDTRPKCEHQNSEWKASVNTVVDNSTTTFWCWQVWHFLAWSQSRCRMSRSKLEENKCLHKKPKIRATPSSSFSPKTSCYANFLGWNHIKSSILATWAKKHHLWLEPFLSKQIKVIFGFNRSLKWSLPTSTSATAMPNLSSSVQFGLCLNQSDSVLPVATALGGAVRGTASSFGNGVPGTLVPENPAATSLVARGLCQKAGKTWRKANPEWYYILYI